jgi:hypothetical protein
MKWCERLRGGLAVLLLAAAPACGGGSSSGSSPSAPTSTATSIAGTWKGTASDSSGPGDITLTITQNDVNVSGTAEFKLTGTSVTGRGTLSGTVSGANVHLTITIPAGGFDAPYSACTATVTTDGQISSASITATYSGTNSCGGPITSGTMTLSKS